jgi:hypothetical protein
VVSGTYVVPRYASFLLVPSFLLLATGCATILERLRERPLLARTALVLGLIALLAVAFPANALRVTGLPREAHKDVARLIESETKPSTTVYLVAPQPDDLRFYLTRRVASLTSPGAARICAQNADIVFVEQRWRVPAVDVPCLDRAGVRHEVFEQYARGGHIDVWFIPPKD